MSDYPDVLDAMGKTPREFVAIHAHFESLQAFDSRRYVASALVQAAFEPMPAAVLAFLSAEGVELARVNVPSLAGGAVLRVRVPLRTELELTTAGLRIECPEPSVGASRVRPAWKLHDTFEIPRLSEMKPVHVDTTVPLGMRFGRVGFVLARLLMTRSSTVSIAENTKTTVHAARELPALLKAELVPGLAEPLSEVTLETLWLPGQEVPLPPPVVPVQAAPPANERRWCRACGFEGPMKDHEKARSCPSCDAPWL